MNSKHIKWTFGAMTGIAAAVLLDALVLEKYFFAVKSFDIGALKTDKSLKLVHLTDLHFKQQLFPHYRKLARKLDKLKPHLLLITGDTLDATGNLKPVDQFFARLNPKIKKVVIPGNHDHKATPRLSELRQVLSKHQVDFLVNESKAYSFEGTRIMITGLDDFIEGKANLRGAVEKVGHKEHHLLLLHSPLQQEETKLEIEKINEERPPEQRLKIGYIFAGHNHGGQVRLPGYVPVLPDKSGDYVNGWFNEQAPYLYVSKGFGTSSIPVRFWARSEITVFNYFV